MTTEAIIPGVTHCHCDPPRYARQLSGHWRRIIWADGRWGYLPVSVREPNCKCGMVVRPQ